MQVPTSPGPLPSRVEFVPRGDGIEARRCGRDVEIRAQTFGTLDETR